MKRALMKTALITLAIACLALTTFGAVPKTMNIQGKLTDAGGTVLPNAPYTVAFTIYDAASGGNILWTEASIVSTVDGIFTELIGDVIPIADSVFNYPNRWLGFKVGADPEMTPRQSITSVPYAMSPPSPIAMGMIQSDGTIAAAWPANIQVSWNATSSWYEITLPGISYTLWNYVTVVTPSSPAMTATSSVSGKMIVRLNDNNGASIQGIFNFIVYKP